MSMIDWCVVAIVSIAKWSRIPPAILALYNILTAALDMRMLLSAVEGP